MNPYALKGDDVQLLRPPRFLSKPFNFRLEPGEAIFVQAPNGGGKTTFLKTLAGLIDPFQGVFWGQHQPISLRSPLHRKQLALAGHKATLRPQKTVQHQLMEGLNFYQSNPRIGEVEETLNRFELAHLLDIPCGVLSQGQQQRLVLSRVCLSKRPCWLLDEPFHHLDSQGQSVLLESLQSHLTKGGTVILTSPHPDIPFLGCKSLNIESLSI